MPSTVRSPLGELLPVMGFLAWAVFMLALIVGSSGLSGPLAWESLQRIPQPSAERAVPVPFRAIPEIAPSIVRGDEAARSPDLQPDSP